MRSAFGATSLRLAALLLAVTFLSTAFVLALIERAASRLIDEEARAASLNVASAFVEIHALGGREALVAAIRRRLQADADGSGIYLLAGPDSAPIAGNLMRWPAGAAISGEAAAIIRVTRTDVDRPAEVSAVALRLSDGARLLVGRDAHAHNRSRRALGGALLVGLAFATVAAVAAGWSLMRMLLGRIEGVSVAARRIMNGDLTTRIDVEDRGDEFDRLADTLNAMFDRMEAHLGELRFATDSIAHDLRTPLTRLRLHLSKAGENPDVAKALAEADRIDQLLTTLLDIARARAGVGREQFERVDLAELAADLVEIYAPIAERDGVDLRLDAPRPVMISGDRNLLFIAASNLIDNALKHAGDGMQVTIAAGSAGETARLIVADSGHGVSDAVKAALGQSSHGSASARAGLGVALVAAVARLHEARLDLEDNQPGLRAALSFASAAALAPPD